MDKLQLSYLQFVMVVLALICSLGEFYLEWPSSLKFICRGKQGLKQRWWICCLSYCKAEICPEKQLDDTEGLHHSSLARELAGKEAQEEKAAKWLAETELSK